MGPAHNALIKFSEALQFGLNGISLAVKMTLSDNTKYCKLHEKISQSPCMTTDL